MESGFIVKIQLAIVRFSVMALNLPLRLLEKILFRKLKKPPRKILVFKVGNIGDIICAIPSFIAIRQTYPEAHITLLTSPGQKGIPGAIDLLEGAWYINELKIYYSNDINSFRKLSNFSAGLRKEQYDLFIQIPPHEWTSFRTFLRNMIFAKILGVKSAFGFKIRVIINLFRKTQVDYTFGKREVETLLEILREGGIKADKVEFDLPLPEAAEKKALELIKLKWPDYREKFLVVIHSGTKANFPEKRWWPERFGEVAQYLNQRYGARVIIAGGQTDLDDARIIEKYLKPEDVVIVAGRLSVIESAALLKHCSFLLGVDSGLMHITASFGKPTIGLFSILNIFGDWFPYGSNHEAVYHRFLNCDYASSPCIKKSMEAITVEEVKEACDRLIARINSLK